MSNSPVFCKIRLVVNLFQNASRKSRNALGFRSTVLEKSLRMVRFKEQPEYFGHFGVAATAFEFKSHHFDAFYLFSLVI